VHLVMIGITFLTSTSQTASLLPPFLPFYLLICILCSGTLPSIKMTPDEVLSLLLSFPERRSLAPDNLSTIFLRNTLSRNHLHVCSTVVSEKELSQHSGRKLTLLLYIHQDIRNVSVFL